MRISALFGIKTKTNTIQKLAENTCINATDAKEYLTAAEGAADLTIYNITKYTNELVNYAKKHNIKIKINKFEDDTIILSIRRNKENARPSVAANFFKDNDKHLPLSEKLYKTIEDAVNNLIKQES